MAQEQPIHGIIAYPITPFSEAGIDTDRLAALVDTMVNAGVHAIAPLGSTGESAYLSFDEWKTVVDTTIAAVAGRVPVVVGASDLTTAGTVARAEYARAGRRHGGDGDSGLLLGAQRARDRPALHRGQRRDLDPDHGLQQPGHLWDRHVADAAQPHVRDDRERHDGQGVHRRHPAHAATSRSSPGARCRSTTAATRWCSRRSWPEPAAGARRLRVCGRPRSSRSTRRSPPVTPNAPGDLRRAAAAAPLHRRPRGCPRRSSPDLRSSASRPAFRGCRCCRSIPRIARELESILAAAELPVGPGSSGSRSASPHIDDRAGRRAPFRARSSLWQLATHLHCRQKPGG